MKAFVTLLGILIASTCFASERVRLEPTGLAKKVPAKDSSSLSEDGLLVRIAVFNDGEAPITLPSRMLGPEISESEDSVTVLFTFTPYTMLSAGRKYLIVPSREAFAPVTIRRGECMFTEFEHRQVAHAGLLSKPVYVVLRTTGFLVDRFGFTPVTLKSPMKVSEVTDPLL